MRVKEITPMDMLKDEIKQLKEEARVFNAYKKLILRIIFLFLNFFLKQYLE